jgi:hypothetical protein
MIMKSRRTVNDEIMQKTCCGGKMVYQDIFGVRRYQCYYRDHHPVLYVNLTTGEMLVDEDGYGPRTIPFHEQES